jgi:MFS family permease
MGAFAFEAMGVATVMPVAVRDLNGLRAYGLVFSVFLTASLLGMVVSGEVSDRRGPVLPFLASAAIFAGGLLLAGLAPNMPLLVAGRAVQGLGSGLNIVAMYVVVARAFPPLLRPRIFSAIAGAWVIPSLIGPPIAGLLADHISWRWVFLGVLPLLAVAVVLVRPHLAGLDEPHTHTPIPSEPTGAASSPSIAPSGRSNRLFPALAAAVGAGLFQFAGQVLVRQPLPAAIMLGIALVLLALGVPRLLPTGSLRLQRGLPTVIVMRGALAGGFFGAEAFVPLMLVEERSLPTTLAGASLTGGAVAWTLGAWLQGKLMPRLGSGRVLTAAFLFVLCGVITTATTAIDGMPTVLAAVGWGLAGFGMGLGITTLGILVLELSPPKAQGVNSAALQISEAVSSILLIGTGGAIFAAYRTYEPHGATPFLLINAIMTSVLIAGAITANRVRPAV